MAVVCIAGMHRSGTSMVAQLLQRCGMSLGNSEEFLPANEFNTEGYFEDRRFVEINDELLAYFNGSWLLPPVSNTSFDLKQVPTALTEKARALVAELGRDPFWGWKDPRNSITLSFWRQFIPELKVILCLRSPLEVARSLAHRDDLPPLRSFDLWQIYNRRLSEEAVPSDLFITHYAAYFMKPEAELERLLAFIEMPAGADRVQEACAASLPGLRHNRSTLSDLIEAGAPAEVTNLYAELCWRSGPIYLDGIKSDIVSDTLDQAPGQTGKDEYSLLAKLLDKDPFVQTVTREIADREQREQDLRSEVEQLQARLADKERHQATRAWRFALLLRAASGMLRGRGALDPELRSLIQERIDDYRSRILYPIWIKRHLPTQAQLAQQRVTSQAFPYRPLISVIMPVYNVDLIWLQAAIDSVRSQSYQNWELCIADDSSTRKDIRPYLEHIASGEPRIKVVFRQQNGHISRASNSAIELAAGEFICMLDHDDAMYPHALFKAAELLNRQPDLDLIYSDSDLILNNRRYRPFFKPNWSPDLFYSNNYLNHLTLLRKSLVEKVGGFRPGFEGSQDYDLYLRVVETSRPERVAQIPDVLYGWRGIPGSAAADLGNKNYAVKAGRRALEQSQNGGELKGDIRPGIIGNTFHLRYLIKDHPLVSIIIVNKGAYPELKACLDSLFQNVDYWEREILVTGNGSPDTSSGPTVRHLAHEPDMNEAQLHNFAVQQAQGRYILFLDGRLKVLTPHFVPYLLEQAQRSEIGAVGPKILFGNSSIYSAGIALGRQGRLYAHVCQSRPDGSYSYDINVVKNYLAVSDLCFLIARDKYEAAGGYDEQFGPSILPHLDFCLKVHDAGHRHLYTPFVNVYNQVPGKETTDRRGAECFRVKWNKYLERDPYYSPNLSRKGAAFSI